MPHWQQARAHPHPSLAQEGGAGLGEGWRGTYGEPPAFLLVRRSDHSTRPVSLRTFTRVGGDDFLVLPSRLLTRLGGGVAGVDVEYRKAGAVGRLWYTPNAVLAIALATTSWVATLASAAFAYTKFVSDGANKPSATSAGWLLVLAACVLGAVALSATLKLVNDIRVARG